MKTDNQHVNKVPVDTGLIKCVAGAMANQLKECCWTLDWDDTTEERLLVVDQKSGRRKSISLEYLAHVAIAAINNYQVGRKVKTDNQHESEVARNERLHELYGEDARERAVALCFRDDPTKRPNIDTLLDMFWDDPKPSLAGVYVEFRAYAAGKNAESLGDVQLSALNLLAHVWLETEEGQELVSTIVHQLAEDEE